MLPGLESGTAYGKGSPVVSTQDPHSGRVVYVAGGRRRGPRTDDHQRRHATDSAAVTGPPAPAPITPAASGEDGPHNVPMRSVESGPKRLLHFQAIGFSAALSPTSSVIATNFAFLEAAGLDVYIESVPWRNSEQHLGRHVVALEYWWQNAASSPATFWTEEELNAAGGRTIHLVIRDLDFEVPDIQQWRFNLARQLLEEGKTVAVPLDQLLAAGHPIEQLVRLSRGLPAIPEYFPPTLGKRIGDLRHLGSDP